MSRRYNVITVNQGTATLMLGYFDMDLRNDKVTKLVIKRHIESFSNALDYNDSSEKLGYRVDSKKV